MSDSESSEPANIPADTEIEQCLRRVVQDAQRAGDEVTVNIARSRAEEELGLDAGFMKRQDQDWKTRSKDIVQTAFDDWSSAAKPKKSAPRPKTKPAAGKKRKPDEAQPPKKKKKQKKSVMPASENEPEVFESNDEHEEADEQPKAATELSEYRTNELSEPPKIEGSRHTVQKTKDEPAAADQDESDLSSVIDDPPPRKKGRQKKSASPSDTKPHRVTKSSKHATAGKELTSDEEEIKRLQGWLLTCGIRKVWGKELAKFDTPKQKIGHLRRLLEEVGMTGRYSVEKARQIKESRELAAELEAAKEFNEKWGQKGEDEGSDESEGDGKEVKARRLKPRGLIDFGDSGDDDSA